MDKVARQFILTVGATCLMLGALVGFATYMSRATVSAQNTSGLGASTPCYVKSGQGTANDSTNHAVCKTAPGVLKGIRAISTAASVAFLELYNSSADPGATPSATNFVECVPIPAATTGAGIVDIVTNFQYTNGIAYIVNGSCSTSSQSNPPAAVFITLKYD